MRSSFIAVGVLGAMGCSSRVIDAVDICCAEGGAAGEGGIADAGSVGSLVHRYRFNGPPGAPATDDIEPGVGDGLIANAQLSGNGYLALAGGPSAVNLRPQYVDLPNFIISRLPSVTLEAWVSWNGAAAAGSDDWQRIFDFGDDYSGADIAAGMPRTDPGDHSLDGRSYLYLTPLSSVGTDASPSGSLRAGFLKPEAVSSLPRPMGVTGRETGIDAPMPFPTGGVHQVAVTVDGQTGQRMSLYLDGQLLGSHTFLESLADIYDVNCWLGRSQFPADPFFNGIYYDFRIYSRALSADDILANSNSGSDDVAIP